MMKKPLALLLALALLLSAATLALATETPDDPPPAGGADGTEGDDSYEVGDDTDVHVYTVDMGPDREAHTGDTVTVSVTIGCEEEGVTGYNAYDLTFRYDPALLTPAMTAESTGASSVTVDETEGTVRLRRFGDTAGLGPVELTFEAVAAGSTAVTVTDARVDEADHAAAGDMPEAEIGDAETGVVISEPEPDVCAVTWTGSGADDVTEGKVGTVDAGSDLVFRVAKEAGCSYSVSVSVGAVAEDPEGTYTVTGITGDVTITVEKLVGDAVEVCSYVEMNGSTAALILVTGDPGDGRVYAFDGAPMFLAANYGSDRYSILITVAEGEPLPTEAEAAARLTVAEGEPAGTVAADSCDVNATGKVDVNDAQLVYNMYMARRYSDFSVAGMAMFLAADVNADRRVDVSDAVAFVAGAE